jgi:hypothetical protein
MVAGFFVPVDYGFMLILGKYHNLLFIANAHY